MFLLYLADALRAQGHAVGLWASTHRRMDAVARSFAAYGDVLRSDYRNLYDRWDRGLLATRSPAAHRARVQREWLGWRPDIVHFNKQCLEDGLDLLDAAASLPVPHLATLHITQSARYLGARLGGLRDWRARQALRRYPGLLVAVAEARGESLRSFLGKGGPEVAVITNGVPPAAPCGDRAALRAREGLSDDLFAVVAIGRLEAQKQPLGFIREIVRLRDAGVPVHGRWIGDGREQARWDAAVERAGIGRCIRHEAWRNDIPAALPAFDLFLHTAAFEGLPLALLEAMQAGLPCVVAEDVARQLPPSLRACVLPLGENLDWAAVLADRPALARLAERGEKTVAAEYSNAIMGAAYVRLYERLRHSR